MNESGLCLPSQDNDSSPKPRRDELDEFSGDKSRDCCDRSPRTTQHLGWKWHVSCALMRTLSSQVQEEEEKAWPICLMTVLLKLFISHHSISFSLSSGHFFFYWMVKRVSRCLKLMIYGFDLVFYLLKNISTAQNLWQCVRNTDGKIWVLSA